MNSIQIIISQIKKHKKVFLLVCIFMLIASMLSYSIPIGIRELSDNILPSLEISILVLCVGLVLIGLIQAGSEYIADRYFLKVSNLIGISLLESFIEKIISAKKKVFSKFDSNTILRIATSDVNQLKQKIIQKYFIIIGLSVECVSVVFFVVLLDWKLGLITFIWYVIFFFTSGKLVDSIRKVRSDERNAYTEVLSYSKDAIFGISDLKYFGNTKNFLSSFHKVNTDYIASDVKLLLKDRLSGYLAMFGKFVNIALIILYKYLFSDETTTGVLLAMYMYSNYYSRIFMRTLSLRADNNDIKTLEKNIDELYNALEEETVLENNSIEKIQTIHAKNLSIKYGNTPIVSNFNVELSSGNIYMIDGKTGVGKTSIINALLGEIEYEGNVLYNETDIKDLSHTFIYEKCAAVDQSVYLFSSTIKENIRLFDTNFTTEEIETVARLVNLPSIEKEIGTSEADAVSGGERKRIALARLLLRLKQKDVIVLDETFANIDINTIKQILPHILAVRSEKIIIVVTHDEQLKEILRENGAIILLLQI